MTTRGDSIEGVLMYMLDDALYAYFSNDATAGADCIATAPPTVTLTLKPTLTPDPTYNPTTTPLSTPHPTRSIPIPRAQPGQAASQGRYLAVIVAAGVIGLAFVVYLVMRRMRKTGKQSS